MLGYLNSERSFKINISVFQNAMICLRWKLITKTAKTGWNVNDPNTVINQNLSKENPCHFQLDWFSQRLLPVTTLKKIFYVQIQKSSNIQASGA